MFSNRTVLRCFFVATLLWNGISCDLCSHVVMRQVSRAVLQPHCCQIKFSCCFVHFVTLLYRNSLFVVFYPYSSWYLWLDYHPQNLVPGCCLSCCWGCLETHKHWPFHSKFDFTSTFGYARVTSSLLICVSCCLHQTCDELLFSTSTMIFSTHLI